MAKPGCSDAVSSGMRTRLPWLVLSLGVLGLGALALRSRAGMRAPFDVPSARAAEGDAPVPVLVELFTSEGCSSCPPAEEELLRLERDQPVAGVRFVPIGFHVDYWNDLGWPDPFSSPAWTNRQRERDRMHNGQLYTPQAVVQGERECNGSDDGALRSLASQAASAPRMAVSVARAPGVAGAPAGPDEVRVAVNVGPLASGATAALSVSVVLVEHDVVMAVTRGENAWRRLHHAPVARDLVRAGSVGAGGGTATATLHVPPSTAKDKLEVVAVVEDPSAGRVVGIGTARLLLPP